MTAVILGSIGLLAVVISLVRLVIWVMEEMDDTDWI